jgi:hypothetical protein
VLFAKEGGARLADADHGGGQFALSVRMQAMVGRRLDQDVANEYADQWQGFRERAGVGRVDRVDGGCGHIKNPA